MKVEDFEKLGVFYLGRRYDLAAEKSGDELILYDSSDLVTHAVCIGMTGSGKTGLCLNLIEEAALDGVPVIAIDPKGDIANLLLTFPNLSKDEFEPWVSEDEARRRGITKAQLAQEQSTFWANGLAGWGEDKERISKLRRSVDMCIFTPGSTAGMPVSIMQNLSAPSPQELEDSDLMRERISGAATSLLALLGMSVEPLKSREHILLANILDQVWRQGENLDLLGLIAKIQKPPMTRIGALDLESFFPSTDRFQFAMSINNLMAAPGFDAWLTGEAMDVNAFLYTKEGKPKVSIFSIAHLSDSERMFFVSLLLNQVLSWMRAQSGTTSLRAVLYMDEIFGYFPPVANPPSKTPLLTLLKQARAYGLGVVLATQNPVDLDYKGLANAGTWFVGRLQTERDKMRLLDGLEGVAAENGAAFDRRRMEQTLSSLKRRVFLINNVHNDGPDIMETRWTMSYLRGPLTRNQIKTLMEPLKSAAAGVTTGEDASPPLSREPAATTAGVTASPAALPPDVPQHTLPLAKTAAPGDKVIYQPMILGMASVQFTDAKAKLNTVEQRAFVAPIGDGALPVRWDEAAAVKVAVQELDPVRAGTASYMVPVAAASQAKNYKIWSKDFAAWLGSNRKFYLLRSPSTGEYSNAGEAERDFRVRLNQKSVEKRDQAVQQLRNKYAPKLNSLEQRILAAEQRVQREEEEARDRQMQAAISIGATILGAFVGRRGGGAGTIGRATTAARGASRVGKQQQEVARAEDTLESLQQQLETLQFEFQSELSGIEGKFQAGSEQMETIAIAAKKAGITVQLLSLAWVPHIEDAQGKLVYAGP